jgi:drug/metabolite transporter (DMT)-like permease
MLSKNRPALIQLIGALLCWSVASIFVRYLCGYMGILTQSTFRYLSASITLFIVGAVLYRGKIILKCDKLLRLIMLTAFFGLLFQLLWVKALYLIKPGSASLISEFGTVMNVFVLSFFYEEEKKTAKSQLFFLSNVVMMIGVSMVILFNRNLSFDFNLGAFLVIASSLCWGLYTVVIKKVLREVNSIIAMAYVAFFISLYHALLGILFGNIGEVAALPGKILFVLILSGIVSIAGSHSFFFMAIKRVGVVISNNFLLLTSVFVCILSYFIFDERLTVLQMTGGALVLGGAYLTMRVQYGGGKKDPD